MEPAIKALKKPKPTEISSDEKTHGFYLHLVKYLSPAYPNVGVHEREKLSKYSFAYFKFTLVIDKLLDERSEIRNKEETLLFFKAIRSFEEAVKNLAFLFPENDPFWEQFEIYKMEYYNANLLEKELCVKRDISFDQFITIAKGKSALCYAITDALGSLNKNNLHGEKIKECLKHIHISAQYRDDVDDFKRDLANNQFTYLHHLLSEELRQINIKAEEIPVELKYKYIFLTGLATESLQQAIHHNILARDYSVELNLPELTQYINYQIEVCKKQIFDINSLIIKSRSLASKSFKVIDPKGVLSKDLGYQAVGNALLYLDSNLNNEGLWEDFLTGKGTSDYWVTSYAGFQLTEMLSFDLVNDANIHALVSKITTKKLKGSYNENMICDGDSFNFLIGFLNANSLHNPALPLNEWLEFMKPNGGWVTYFNSKTLEVSLQEKNIDTSGWTTPKCCVTAASCYFLSDIPELRNEYDQTSLYLIDRQHPDGYWESYWWSDHMYATSWAITALCRGDKNDKACRKAVEWIIRRQNMNGSWNNGKFNTPNAFYTSLALKALLAYDKVKYEAEIQKGVSWLLNNQMTDGSWMSSHILQIPSTDVHNPETILEWRKGSYGPNIIVEDYNRIMTTSTTINVVGKYLFNYPH